MPLYDNTRISSFKRCPRKYFFRHVLHWRTKGTRAPLVFGGAWHAAMEVIWPGLQNTPIKELSDHAFSAWTEKWVADGMPHPNEMSFDVLEELMPRTPGVAYEMILAYIEHRKPHASDFEIISIEKPFIVPLGDGLANTFYVGKIDKIVRYQGRKLLGIEHKTTTMYKKNGPFRGYYLEHFGISSQVDGYLYAMHLMFPGQVGGVWVDNALVHKTEEGFKFQPVEKRMESLEAWLWDTQWWIRRIEEEHDALLHVKPRDAVMTAFPKQTEACMDFNSLCEYFDLCRAWPNPVARTQTVPDGYIQDVWDPLVEIKGLEDVIKAGDSEAERRHSDGDGPTSSKSGAMEEKPQG